MDTVKIEGVIFDLDGTLLDSTWVWSQIDTDFLKKRGFEVARGFEDEHISLPRRATKHSAGYDFEAAEDTLVPSIWSQKEKKPTFVKTGVKAYMQEDEALFLFNRSSGPFKKGLVMANSVGVVDSDYYNN